MDSRDHFIEDTDIRHEKIVLTWRASAFIESLPNEMTIQEVLHSNTFDTKADIRSYWSVPERLVDIRWLSDRQRGIEQDLEDGSFSSYVKIRVSTIPYSNSSWRISRQLWENYKKVQ